MQRSNDLFESIQEVIGKKYQQEVPETNYLMAEWESAAPLEQVRLFEAREAIRSPNVSKKQLAEAMVEISNSSYMTNPDRDADSAITFSIQNFRTQSHLRESWQAMGKMIEEAHKRFSIDLKEALGSYNETQVNLLEMTLELPWKLSYSEPVDVEIQDYPVPQNNDPWKGKTAKDMQTDDDSEVETHDVSDEEEDQMDDEDYVQEESKSIYALSLSERLRVKRNEQRSNKKEQ